MGQSFLFMGGEFIQLSLTIEEISRITAPRRIRGECSAQITGIASLAEAREGDISFLGNVKYKKEAARSRASVIFVPTDYDGEPRDGQALFYQESATLALAQICHRIEQQLWPRPAPGIHPTAIVHPHAHIADSATIGPFCVIEKGVKIGENTFLQAQVFIGRHTAIGKQCWMMSHVSVQGYCTIGDRVRFQPGVIMGSDGYGYVQTSGRHERIPQIGRVIVGNDVEIGANTTVDRARFDRTEIGDGTKIDNLVQIGHNVIIGKHCLIVAQVGIAGSARIDDNVVMGGQVGVADHLHVGEGSVVGAQSGINRDIAARSRVSGSPAIPHVLHKRLHILSLRLPELFRDVDRLSEEIRKLSATV